MCLFLLYLFVHFVNVVDLWDPKDFRVHDKAAETAKLINIVQKANNFEVKYPLKSKARKDERDKDTGADDPDIFETMKLLQMNYDVNRKFNEIPKKERLQYISNPEILESYKSLRDSKKQADMYDDLDKQDSTQRSYVKELTELRYFRTNDKNRTETGLMKSNNNNAANKTNKRRHIGENQNSDDHESASDTCSGNSEEVNKQIKTFNFVKPIVVEMLSKYIGKDSQETITSDKNNVDSHNSAKAKSTFKENLKTELRKTDEDTQTQGSESNLAVQKSKMQKQVSISEKVVQSVSSGDRKNKKYLRNKIVITDKSNEEDDPKDVSDFPTKSTSIVNFDVNPTVIIEDNTSEEINQNNDHNNRVNYIKSDRTDKKYIDKMKSKLKKNKSEIEKESDKDGPRVSMEEQVIDWGGYDEKKDSSKQSSETEYENSNDKNEKVNKEGVREKNKNKSDKKNDKYVGNKNENSEGNDSNYKTKISTKRKGDWNEKNDQFDQNYDDLNKDDNISNKKLNSWSEKEDNSHKKQNMKKKSKNVDYDLKDTLNKKKDIWNKNDDDWDNKNDKIDKENDYYVKEDKKKVNKIDWNKNDEDVSKSYKTAGKLKKDSGWDSERTNKKQNSGWGSYDSFKNVIDKKNKNVEDKDRQVEIKKPDRDFKVSIHNSWDNPAPKRDNYYDKPRKPGRMSNYRTSIPFVGKRPLYAD